MGLADLILRPRWRAPWKDPVRTIRTLESFSRTEEDGGRDIGSAAGKTADPELRGHLERHARDELHHAQMFRERAAELRREHGLSVATGSEEPLYDLSRGRDSSEVNAHGFFKVGLFDRLGEVAYVGMLHTAERAAARLFEGHHALTAADPRTQEIFARILRDEHYHVAYTRAMLERWTAEGRGREVAQARAMARGGRLWGAWKRLGARSGAGFGRVLLAFLYLTLLAPFGMLAARQVPPRGWQGTGGTAGPGADALRRQS